MMESAALLIATEKLTRHSSIFVESCVNLPSLVFSGGCGSDRHGVTWGAEKGAPHADSQ